MFKKVIVGFGLAIALIVVGYPADATTGGGVCADLGCVGGEVKCADGNYERADGSVVFFTCFTTIQPN